MYVQVGGVWEAGIAKVYALTVDEVLKNHDWMELIEKVFTCGLHPTFFKYQSK